MHRKLVLRAKKTLIGIKNYIMSAQSLGI